MRTRSLTTAAVLLGACSLAPAATNVFKNADFEMVGPLGQSVTTLGIGGGPSAADQWLQDTVTGSFLTTSLDTSSDTLLAPQNRGNMLILVTDGGVGGGSTGNGVGTLLNSLLPVGSSGQIDIKVVSGNVSLGFVDNSNCCTFFDSGGTFFNGGTGDWQRITFTNKDLATGAFEIQIHAPAGGQAVLYVDHAFAAAVPEPASAMLMALGLAAFAIARRRLGMRE